MSTYTVQHNETMTQIAKDHKVTLAALKKANPQIENPDVIFAGEHLTMPGIGAAFIKPPKKPTAKIPAKVAAALKKANATLHWPRGLCDNFCAEMYGFAQSGYTTAAKHWASVPERYRHPGDADAPIGAIKLYGGGTTGAGHATISEGKGKERTIDMKAGRYSPGNVSTATHAQVLGWGTLHYLGWIDPFFQGHFVVKVGA